MRHGAHPVDQKQIGHRRRLRSHDHQHVQIRNGRADQRIFARQKLQQIAVLPVRRGEARPVAHHRANPHFPKLPARAADDQRIADIYIIKPADALYNAANRLAACHPVPLSVSQS